MRRQRWLALASTLVAGVAAASTFLFWFSETGLVSGTEFQTRGVDTNAGKGLLILGCIGVFCGITAVWIVGTWLRVMNLALGVCGIASILLAAADYQSRPGDSWTTTSGYWISLGFAVAWAVIAAVAVIDLSIRTRGTSADITALSFGLVLAGASLMLLAVFLPQFESSTYSQIEKNSLIQNGYGWVFIGLAVGAAGAAYRAYRNQKRSFAAVVIGMVGIGFAIFAGTSHSARTLCSVDPVTFGQNCTLATAGIGIYAASVGALLVIIGGWQMWRAPAPETPTEKDEASAKDVPGDGETLAERMRTLDRLRAQGLLGEDEYAEQRRRLLNEI